MKATRQILQLDVKIGSVSGEAAKRLPIPYMHGDKLITLSNLRVRVQQRFSNLVHRQLLSHIR